MIFENRIYGNDYHWFGNLIITYNYYKILIHLMSVDRRITEKNFTICIQMIKEIKIILYNI